MCMEQMGSCHSRSSDDPKSILGVAIRIIDGPQHGRMRRVTRPCSNIFASSSMFVEK
jgi:hypothetical protein